MSAQRLLVLTAIFLAHKRLDSPKAWCGTDSRQAPTGL